MSPWRYICLLGRQIQARDARREQAARNHAAWEKISDLPIGARVAVNAAGSDKPLPRGTILEIVSFDTAGRKRWVELKREQGKKTWFGPRHLEYWDIQPVNEADLSGPPNRMHLSF